MNNNLDHQYSPSMWAQRFENSEATINHFVEFGRKKTQENQKNFKCELNISYGNSDREKLDLYGANLPKNSPLFVFVHGGYWQAVDKEISGYPIKPFIENGIKVMIVDYDLCPKVTLSEIVYQMQKAGKFIFNYCEENEIEKLSISGHSAGAHLISYLLTKDFVESVGDNFNILKSLYFVSGVYDLKTQRHVKAVNENNLLSITDDNEEFLSPLYHNFSHLVDKQLNYHVLAAEFDSPMFQKESLDFYSRLKNVFQLKNTNFEVYSNLDHFDIVEKLSESDYKMSVNIIKELK